MSKYFERLHPTAFLIIFIPTQSLNLRNKLTTVLLNLTPNDTQYPSILSALQAWVSLGLLNNHSPLLSVFRLLHPLLYLHYFQICYNISIALLISCTFPGINIVLTFQVAITKSDFQAPFVNNCFQSFRG
jgi:hypothetical protein